MILNKEVLMRDDTQSWMCSLWNGKSTGQRRNYNVNSSLFPA